MESFRESRVFRAEKIGANIGVDLEMTAVVKTCTNYVGRFSLTLQLYYVGDTVKTRTYPSWGDI